MGALKNALPIRITGHFLKLFRVSLESAAKRPGVTTGQIAAACN
jgi:hypothetical protein